MSIKTIIYKTLEDNNKQYIPQYHNPSSASLKLPNGQILGKDLKSLYLKWKGILPSNPIESGALLRMEMGNGIHDIIAKILNKAGIKHISEVAGKSEVPGLKHKVSYRVDGLFELDGQLEVLEVKSSTDQQMFGKGWGIEDTGAKADHLLQVCCYLNLVPGVKQARLLYISRDSGRMIEYIYKNKNIGEITFSKILQRWIELETYLERNLEPDPDFKVWLNDDGNIMDVKQIKGKKYKSDWQALYDGYRDLIWKDPKNFEHTYNAQFKAKGLI
jgi:hypothetical protein